MPNFSQSFLSTFIPSFQRAQASRAAQSQAESEAQQLQDRERQALVRTLLGDENVAASAKNQLLASILPQFRQQTEVTTTVPGMRATAKPVQLGRELTASAPSNLPTEADLPQSGVYNEQTGEHVNLLNRLGAAPTAQMIDREAAARDKFSSRTPVGMPTTPRGSLSPEVSLRSGPDSQETKTVTTPMEVFQDKAEKKVIDPLITEAAKTGYDIYKAGGMSEQDMRDFLPTIQEAIRTGDYSKIKFPKNIKVSDPDAELRLRKLQLDIDAKRLKLEQDRAAKETPFRFGKEGTGLTLDLKTQARKEMEDYSVVVDNLSNINAVIDRLKTNPDEINRIATDQGVITSFNKILDPRSVVRESEYARTEANQSLTRRAQGWFDKLARGGTSLTQKDLIELQDTAKAMAELRRQVVNKKLENLRKLGKARNLDPDEFAPLLEQQSISTPQAAPPAVKTPNGDFGDEDIDKLFNK